MPEQPGEFELIAALRERARRAGAPEPSRLVVGSGDDATVATGGPAVVTSVDSVVEGVHFERPPFPPRAIGHKALAAALSDIAAMGARPGEAYVQLLLPDDLDVDACLELADGLAAVAARHGVAIAGGDVSRAPVLALAITVVGYLDRPEDAVRRAGAAPGDLVVVTGELGGAAAGLLALRDADAVAELDPAVVDRLRRRQLEPEPRLAAGGALAAAGATAMIDLSDGLGADAAHLAGASGVRIAIDVDGLPVEIGVADLAAAVGADPLDLAAGGGEDYELLATLPPARVEEARSAVEAADTALSGIGRVDEGTGVELTDARGASRSPAGYDQLAGRRAPRDRAGRGEAWR